MTRPDREWNTLKESLIARARLHGFPRVSLNDGSDPLTLATEAQWTAFVDSAELDDLLELTKQLDGHAMTP